MAIHNLASGETQRHHKQTPNLCVGATFILILTLPALKTHAQLVGYWPFNGNTSDLSGQENDGVLFGGAYENDIPAVLGVGQSLSLNGPPEMNDHVAIAGNPSLDSNVFTLSMFVNDRGQASGINRLTSRAGDSFETGIDQVFGTNSYSYYPGWVTTGAVPTLNTWEHVAYVADGTNMTVYVDGEIVPDPQPFSGSPFGEMYIGKRVNGEGEGFHGLIDDVALFSGVLSQSSIADLASGAATPLMVEVVPPPPPPPAPDVIVTSNAQTWTQSTEIVSGGPAGEWKLLDAVSPPDISTFTLTPAATAPAVIGHNHAAAAQLSDGNATVEGLVGDNAIHFYRTTFDLAPFESISGSLQWAADNGGVVFVNGQGIVIETSFLAENWTSPMPSIQFNEDGTTSDVIKFDAAAGEFEEWLVGENEIVVALRNPDDEVDPAGGFALRLELSTYTNKATQCDFNNDSRCDLTDVDLLGAEIMAGTNNTDFDLTGDGNVDLLDQDQWRSDAAAENGFAAAYRIGDVNLNGTVDSVDLNVIGINWQQNVSPWSKGDFDLSGFVDAGDLNQLGINWQSSLPLAATANAVPEPSSPVLLFLGILLSNLAAKRSPRVEQALSAANSAHCPVA